MCYCSSTGGHRAYAQENKSHRYNGAKRITFIIIVLLRFFLRVGDRFTPINTTRPKWNVFRIDKCPANATCGKICAIEFDVGERRSGRG